MAVLPADLSTPPNQVPVSEEIQEVEELTPAIEVARATGRPVRVNGLTDERTTHTVNPDGTVNFEQYLAPQRVRKSTGWTPIDTALTVVGGRVQPGATLLDVSLSAGGTEELISLRDGQKRLGLSWPSQLPAPILDGNTATYTEVFPGVDLVITVEAESFSQVLVVKSRQAGNNPALSRIRWRITTHGVSLRAQNSGAIDAVDSDGKVVFHAPPSVMWDSPARTVDPMAGRLGEPSSAAQHEPDAGKVVNMRVQVSNTELAVLPDLAMLADKDTVFPVRIDPAFGSGAVNWAPVEKSAPNNSWPSGTAWPREIMRVGDDPESSRVFREFMRFNISSMLGHQLVYDPSFTAILDHSGGCANTPVALWYTANIGASGVTWNNTGSFWWYHLGDQWGSANDRCSALKSMGMEWTNGTIRNWLQNAMNGSGTDFTLAFRAVSETDQYQWKKFITTSPKLSATYNTKPALPTALKFAADCSECDNDNAILRVRRPQLRASVSDVNNDVMTVQFEVRNSTQGTVLADSGETVTSVSNGAVAPWTVAVDLPVDQVLYFRVRAKDPFWWGDWSGWRKFIIDVNAPNLPVPTSTAYPHKDTGIWSGGTGVPGNFTFTPNGSTDVIRYEWRWNGGAVSSQAVSQGASATVSIAPPGDLLQTLEVRSVDKAGYTSTGWAAFPIRVKPAAVDKAYWKFNEASGTTTAAATGGTKYNGALYSGAVFVASQIGTIDPAASGNALSLNGTTGGATMPTTLNTAQSFTVSAWAKLTDATKYRTVVAQNGVNQFNFRVYFKPDANDGLGGWCFGMRAADETAAATYGVCAPADQVRLGEWTFLAATFDATTKKMRLYVDGGPQNGEWPPGWTGETSGPTTPWASTGSFVIGHNRAGSTNALTDWFAGSIDEVRAYQRIVPESEIVDYFSSCKYGACTPIL